MQLASDALLMPQVAIRSRSSFCPRRQIIVLVDVMEIHGVARISTRKRLCILGYMIVEMKSSMLLQRVAENTLREVGRD